MIRLAICCWICTACLSCQWTRPEERFQHFAETFEQSRRQQFPMQAVLAGDLPASVALPIPTTQKRTENLAFCQTQLRQLQVVPANELSPASHFKYQSFDRFLRQASQNLSQDSILRDDARYYDLQAVFRTLFRRAQHSPAQTLAAQWLQQLPQYYAQAKQNLKDQQPQYLLQAIEQQTAFYQLLKQYSRPTNLDAKRTAQIAVKDFIAFLISLEFEQNNLIE